jgi:type II secretory pathway component GspD/PulD (secretin)
MRKIGEFVGIWLLFAYSLCSIAEAAPLSRISAVVEKDGVRQVSTWGPSSRSAPSVICGPKGIELFWGPASSGSEIESYTVQYMDEDRGGGWEEIPGLIGTKATRATFIGIPGHRYRFRTIAVDASGIKEDPEAVISSAPPPLTIRGKDVEIVDLLRAVARKMRANVIFGPDVSGKVTVEFEEVPVDLAFELILRASGFWYEKFPGNIYHISKSYSPPPVKEGVVKKTVKVFSFKHAVAFQVQDLIKPLLSKEGVSIVDVRTNQLIVNDMDEVIKRIEEIIEKVDIPVEEGIAPPQEGKGLELPEPYPIKLKYIKPSKFKEMISGIGLVPAEKIQTDDEKDLVIVMTTKQTISAIRKLVEEVDIPPKRVTVEAKIIEVSADSLKDLGISWSDSVSLSLELSPSPELPIPTKVATARLSAISTSLNLLERQGKARTLENSRMTVLSNQTANILGGEKIPIVTRMPIGFPTGGVVGGIPTAPGYVTETLQIQYVEVGIKLTVTPRVNEEDVITMDIKPEVSTVAGWRGPNNDIPIVKTREARTTVWVRDGDTILLGGLTSEEKRTTTTKTPILGDLPIIGRLLFTRKREDTMKTELIIMIVPQILREKGS